jgi:NADPH2:quinone reductase
MKALQFDRVGSLDALRQVELPMPVPQAGEALVEVRAAGLNPSDVKNVLGRFAAYTTLPRVPGRDFAGVVVEGPSQWLGKEVWGTGRDLGFFRDGSHAEYLTLPATGLSLKPQALSFVQAASCGVPFTTALNALDRTGVAAQTRMLILGAAGAVGSAALALARRRGAEVVAAVRRDEQFKALQAAGIPALLLDSNAQWTAALKALWAEGADVIFDTTGFWLPAAVEALARLGRIAVIAAPPDGQVQLPVLNLYRRGGSIVGINTLLYDCAECAVMLTRMSADFDAGHLQAPPDLQTCPLSEGLAAYAETNRGGASKWVLTKS